MNFISLKYIALLLLAAICAYRMKPKIRNPILLILNLGFYFCFGPKHLPFLITVTLLSYITAIIIEKELWGKRKLWIVIGLMLNFGILVFFKYFNFFAQLVEAGCTKLGVHISDPTLELILPVGISFYVFQVTGYLIDVYRGNQKAERNLVDFALFASFFPAIVSGPIQRAKDMLPQYKVKNTFYGENLKIGILQFMVGVFKKLVIADQLAVIVNTVYAKPLEFSGLQTLVAVFAYSIQIYCDFSAYSDMAIGSAKIMGFNIVKNFDNPYFAVSLQDFWRRWHISLTTWFRDYLYIPLGGNRKGKMRQYINVVVVFLVSGLWHGAAMGFVVWGLIHGVLQVVGKILKPYRDKIREGLHISSDSQILNVGRTLFTFAVVTFAWIFFRADSFDVALTIISNIFTGGYQFAGLTLLGLSKFALIAVFVFTVILLSIERLNEKQNIALKLNDTYVRRYAVYFIIFAVILIFGRYGSGFDPMDFVYFKF